jgi:hypothetical protein
MGQGYAGGTRSKTKNLKQEGPYVPFYGFQVMRGNLDELEKQQNSYEPSLAVGSDVVADRAYRPQCRREMIYQI